MSLGINEIDVCFTADDLLIQLQKITVLLSETCDFKRFRKWPWSSPEILRYLWRSIWRWSVRCGKAGLHHSLRKGWSGSNKIMYQIVILYWFYDCFLISILVTSCSYVYHVDHHHHHVDHHHHHHHHPSVPVRPPEVRCFIYVFRCPASYLQPSGGGPGRLESSSSYRPQASTRFGTLPGSLGFENYLSNLGIFPKLPSEIQKP